MDHIPVLLNETIASLNLKNNAVYLDATAGRGGHLEALISNTKNSKIIAVDKDCNNINYLDEKFGLKEPGFVKIKNNFIRTVFADYRFIKDILAYFNIDKLDGVIADLGFCSTQIEDTSRGFSFLKTASLDMRYDTINNKKTASSIINEYSFDALLDIFKNYGEERFAKLIADKIVLKRKTDKIKTTTELANLIYNTIPKKFHTSIHPATKVFQALRIEVNQELSSLNIFLNEIPYLLNKEARLAVISFHSIEDRIVKTILNNYTNACSCQNYICTCTKDNKLLDKINKKPILATSSELDLNIRARSAKLRVYERI